MPRYYCDYCDTYLTHDSPSVRKQHNQGYKHKANVRSYYQQFEEQQTQSLIDQKVKEHLHMGGGFMLQPGAYRPPTVMRPLTLPVPGSNPSMFPTARPLMPPIGSSSGYMTPPTFRPPAGVGPQGNGLPLPPAVGPISAPGVRPVTTTPSNGTLPNSVPPQGPYQQPPTSMPASYNYTPPSGGTPGGYSLQQSSVNAASHLNSGFGSAPPGTMPPGNFQSSQGTPTANSYGASTVGVSSGYRT